VEPGEGKGLENLELRRIMQMWQKAAPLLNLLVRQMAILQKLHHQNPPFQIQWKLDNDNNNNRRQK
jgi:hypothetical protein